MRVLGHCIISLLVIDLSRNLSSCKLGCIWGLVYRMGHVDHCMHDHHSHLEVFNSGIGHFSILQVARFAPLELWLALREVVLLEVVSPSHHATILAALKVPPIEKW